jgi:molybdate transport system regulatory protein
MERIDGLRPRVELWVEAGGGVVLSDWRVALLEAVAATGSLAGAAERLDTPYRTVWHRLRQMERGLGRRLVASHSGGPRGGGARPTPAARRYVAGYRTFAAGLHDEIDRRFAAAFSDTGWAAGSPAPLPDGPTEPKVRRHRAAH